MRQRHFKSGTKIEVEVLSLDETVSWEPAKIGRWLTACDRNAVGPDWYPVTFADGNKLMLHESRFRPLFGESEVAELRDAWNRRQRALARSFLRSAEHCDRMADIYDTTSDGRRRRKAIKMRKEAEISRSLAAKCLAQRV